MQVDFIEP
jgi:hypothetical protein